MGKSVALILLSALLVACNEPNQEPERVTRSKMGRAVAEVVNYDGCTLYRIFDAGETVYWAKCETAQAASTAQSKTVLVGKVPVTRTITVPTAPTEAQP